MFSIGRLFSYVPSFGDTNYSYIDLPITSMFRPNTRQRLNTGITY